MTTYVAITAGQIDADSPVDTVLTGQWTNNLLAIQEGDASAPKIQVAALIAPAAGTTYTLIELATETSGMNTSYAIASIEHKFRCLRAGTYTITFDLKSSSVVNAAYGRIYKNGVAFGAEQSTTSTSYVEKSEALTFAAGDTIELWTRRDGAVTWFVKDYNVKSSVEPYAALIIADPA